MKTPIIVALDFASKNEVFQFLKLFDHEKLFVKVGMEIFYQEGPAIVHEIKEQGHDIFLDLKLHDIPNTVKRAMTGLAKLGCDLVNVHAAGGQRDDGGCIRRIRCRYINGSETSELYCCDTVNEHV